MEITIMSILIAVLLIISLSEVFISISGYRRQKKHSQHFLSDDIMIKMADIMVGCPIKFISKHTKLIPSSPSDQYLHDAEKYLNPRIVDHAIVPDPYDNERKLTIFVTNSTVFPYFLADESDLIDLIDARIHSKEKDTMDDDNCDDCDDCMTAVDGHIEDLKSDEGNSDDCDGTVKKTKSIAETFALADTFKY